MGKKALKLDSPSDGKSAKKKSSTPRTKGRPRKSMMRQHRRQSLEAESPEQPHSPQVESPLLKPDEEDTQQTTRLSKGDKPSQRALTSLQWPKRGKSDNNNASAEVHQNGPSPTTTARRSNIMSWRSRNSTASVVEEAPRPLSCQPSSCFIGSLKGTTNEMHLPLLTKQTKARLNALKAAPKQRQLEVTIERSDELPFGAYSHPQVRVHIVDRCTGRAICPVQMTKEAKFCVSSDKNTSCTNAFDWQQTLGISVDIPALLSPRTVLLFEILETKLPSKGTRFRRGKQFESVSTHDDDDEYRHSPGTSSASEYRRIAWGFFHAITNKGTPTMNSFVLPHVADAKESEAVKKPSIVDVCGLRVRLFQYQVVTWMDSYQAKLQWGWRKNHPTMPAVFLQYQKRSRVPAPSTLHIQLKAASPLASPRQTGIPESQETTDVAPDNEQESNNASIDPESGGGDNQEQPTDALLPDAREVESKIASNVTNGTPNVVFDLIAPCKRNPSEPCLIPQRVLCSLPTGKRGCSAVSFSICGRYLAASVSPDLGEFVIRVYQMASAELFAVGRGHRGVIYSLEWTTTSTGQSRILSASSDGTVRLWEIPTNAPSPQGSPRVSAFRYPRLLSLVFQWHHFPCFVYCAIFLPGSNGDIVLTGASDGCMRFRKESLVPNGQPEYGSVHVSSVAVHTICVDSKSGRVFCGDANGYITVWSRGSSALSFYEYTLIKTIHTGQTSITSLQLHPRKAHLLAHTQPNAIFQYELRSYLLLNKSYAGVVCESLLVKSTFSPDGKLVISGSEDGVPRLFASIHGQQLQRGVWGTHLFHGSPVLDVSWSPTAHVAALCSYGGDNPIVVLCSYRDDKDAVFIDESATTTISSATPSIQQLAVDAFRAGNQQDVLTGDHAQRLQRALERRRQRLQSKLSLETQASREPTSSAAV